MCTGNRLSRLTAGSVPLRFKMRLQYSGATQISRSFQLSREACDSLGIVVLHDKSSAICIDSSRHCREVSFTLEV